MLDPSADEIRRWGAAAVEGIAEYLGTIRTKRVYPQTSAEEIRAQLDSALPLEGVAFEELLETFQKVAVPLSRQNGHPRMFGYVQAPGNALAAFADLLASTVNSNLTAWRSAPAAVEMERLTIDCAIRSRHWAMWKLRCTLASSPAMKQVASTYSLLVI
jgi:glutamate/tyrosine decarboxylase-like PLP-dependent enzyme